MFTHTHTHTLAGTQLRPLKIKTQMP